MNKKIIIFVIVIIALLTGGLITAMAVDPPEDYKAAREYECKGMCKKRNALESQE